MDRVCEVAPDVLINSYIPKQCTGIYTIYSLVVTSCKSHLLYDELLLINVFLELLQLLLLVFCRPRLHCIALHSPPPSLPFPGIRGYYPRKMFVNVDAHR